MTVSVHRYNGRAIALHWLVMLALAATIPLGIMLEKPPEGWGDTLYRLHWSFGMTVLFLMVLRLANRAGSGAPPPHATLTPIERTVSSAVHHALYLLLFVVPLLGWAGKSAYGGAITIFGLFDMPAILGQNEPLAKTLLGAHKIAVKLLMACVVLHVAGAMNHLIIKRDGVMSRMLPGRD